jgi:hypothetical protein
MPSLEDILTFARSRVNDSLFQLRARLRPRRIGGVQSPDPAYRVIHPRDFPGVIKPARYGNRASAFDSIIASTHHHYWNPLDKAYIDFDVPFDLENDYVIEPEAVAFELKIGTIRDRLDEPQRIKLANDSAHWFLSQILHGEQGALALSATLCQLLEDPGAQEFAANQVREEARHVTAFARYIRARWGEPLPAGLTLARVLDGVVQTNTLYKKIVGMQMLVEGLAMGAFTYFHGHARDPVLKRLLKFVMADEATHHKFGTMWAHATIPGISRDDRREVEEWAASVFLDLCLNLVTATQKRVIYANVGLDWRWVQRTLMKELDGYGMLKEEMKETSNVFRVLIKTLLKAGIITEHTERLYRNWIDLDELRAEGEGMPGDAIAEEGLSMLTDINQRGRRRVTRAGNGASDALVRQ